MGTGLTERNKERTRREIAEAAGQLFIERGYGATTVQDIANAADVSPRTFFRYFPCKEDVITVIASTHHGRRPRPPGRARRQREPRLRAPGDVRSGPRARRSTTPTRPEPSSSCCGTPRRSAGAGSRSNAATVIVSPRSSGPGSMRVEHHRPASGGRYGAPAIEEVMTLWADDPSLSDPLGCSIRPCRSSMGRRSSRRSGSAFVRLQNVAQVRVVVGDRDRDVSW